MEHNDLNHIEIHSENVRDIIGQPPARILKYGITVISCLIFIIVTGSFFFKYPDIIKGKCIIVSSNPPVFLKAKKNEIIDTILVCDKEKVSENDLIAVLKDAANYQDILTLDSFINTIRPDTVVVNTCPENLRLGSLQPQYAELLKHLSSYHDFISMDFYRNEISVLERRSKYFQSYIQNLQRQLSLKEKEAGLSYKTYSRDSIMFVREFLSESEFEQSQLTWYQHLRDKKNLQSKITDIKLELNAAEKDIITLQREYHTQETNYENNIRNSAEQIKGSIEQWKEINLLKSPTAGTVSFSAIWEENQFVVKGQTVFTIVPEEDTDIIGKILIPIERAGKIKPGQTINLKFDNYPVNEYGMITTSLSGISLVPDSFYTGSVELPDKLVTNFGITLPFSQNMQGTAEIITEKRSLAYRIFTPVKAIVKEHF